MKKALALVLTFALIVTLLPTYMAPQTASAAGTFFLFPNENDTRENARIVSTKTIQIDGTINGVVGSSISYNVKQVTSTGLEEVLNTTEEITTGISTTGDNRISINSLILFPGMNKITLKGIAGTSIVSEPIYIEYRDNPMLYDLRVSFENKDYEMKEAEPTMLYSTAPNITQQGQIVITGRAPNATKVTIDINGRSYDFNVSTGNNNNRFSTSQLTIDKGINNIKFKVHNGGQIVETTRQVAFYNGEVTYYDLKISDGATPSKESNLQNNMDFSTSSGTGIKLSGKAIIPLPLYDLDGNNKNDTIEPKEPGFSTKLRSLMALSIQGVATDRNPTSISYTPATIDDTTKFITVDFSYNMPTLAFDVKNSIRFKAPNLTKFDFSTWFDFTLRNDTKAYIHDINYLTGFDSSMTDPIENNTNMVKAKDISRVLSLQSTDIPSSGVDVYSVPMGVELLIGNYGSIVSQDLSNLNDLVGKILVNTVPSSTALSYRLVGESNTKPLGQIVTRTVNNEQESFLRLFVEIQKMPTSGSNTLTFKLNHASASSEATSVVARLLYGPYMKFDSIVDGMDVRFDTVNGTPESLLNQLGFLKGQLFNVVNDGEINYSGTNQSVFMYINNVAVDLEKQTGSVTKFQPKNIEDAAKKGDVQKFIAGILNKAGDNTIKFVFASKSNNYEYTLRFSIVPTNLPTVPAPNTDGVYPYTKGQWPPVSADSSFNKQGSVYTTREAEFDVYGTFDFVDLGTDPGDVESRVNSANLSNPQDYIVTIESPDWQSSVNWNLTKQFMLADKNRNIVRVGNDPNNPYEVINGLGGEDPATPDAAVQFFYDYNAQNFFFTINNQVMPEDGSSLVYVITVFNAGVNGPRATYRLEINPISIPYSIKSPVKEELVTNKNFVEVIISSPGADSIVIGKEKAEKVTFIDYASKDGATTYTEAFRAVVKDLRAGRETKIPFQITRGEDTIKQELLVKYVPTNIPGAQMLQTMASSHKLFNNTLTLTFSKNTQLIRPDYNASTDHATQVYNGNDILFAIANPNDGIVDRHLYDGQPPNYSATSQAAGNLHIGYRFQDEARQFIKASPLYWIDGGLADNPDPTSPAYDPITTGQDPFPFPNLQNKYTDNFAARWGQFDRELSPSSPGQLTLTYDSNVVQSAGTTITVFRFDPYNSKWENIGGVVDEKKRTITVPFTKFGYYVAVKLTRGFNDITDHPYAREAMEAIFAKGIMNAIDPVGMFGGDRYVTRGEFTRMIVRALDLPLNYQGDLHFSYYPETITNANQSSSIYDYRYIETAARAGIVNGKRPGFFDEDVELTRQEGAVILARALQLKLESDATKAKKSLDKSFKDSGSFDFYSIPSVLAIEKKGFIQGKPINPTNPKEGYVFDPKARLLRSDAAIIMARVMNDMKKLPKIYN